MKFATTAFKAALASSQQYFTTCWLTIRVDGSVQGFTALDHALTFNLEAFLTAHSLFVPSRMVGSGSQVYNATAGYKRTDVVSTSDLSVDNLEVHGPMVAPSLLILDDILAGLDDFCFVCVFMVNYSDLTQGALILRCGTIGEITTERNAAKAEVRGLTQALTRQLGELTGPMCRANLGDARCKVDLVPFTVTGTIEAVNDDDVTLYDSARTEAGPTGGVSITNVSNANPGVVTMLDDSLALTDGETVTIATVLGPALVNSVTVALNPSGNTFDLSIDTSDTGVFPPYVSGGTVTPLGRGTSGYFTNGVITFTSGANSAAGAAGSDLSMEIKSYDVGVWTLYLPMPYAVQVGDTYTMVAGCDKTIRTCIDKFSNAVNFRGEPFLPGVDKIVQIPKRS